LGPEEHGITSRDPDEQQAMPDLDREERLVALVVVVHGWHGSERQRLSSRRCPVRSSS
jgi:hypothetical protein